MKVAVLVSGVCKTSHPLGDLNKFNKRQQRFFPGADFYYATWKSFKDELDEIENAVHTWYYDEPDPHYHPYLGVPVDAHVSPHFTERVNWAKGLDNKKVQWTKQHAKQHLIHAWLFDNANIKDNYDVVVRARFDGFIHKNADFSPYLEDSFKNKNVHGFSVTRQNMFDKLYHSPMEKGSKHSVYMLDQMIIHSADRFDTEMVYKLYKEKKLHAAEFGWYQVLSQPYGGIHRNHHGFVNHDKNVLDRFLLDLE
jgi:hypothetical protein